MDKYIGKRLDGRYEIDELIGIGGMAMVYKAFDNQENKIVAIKILKEEYLDNKDFIRRFKNESRAIAMLSHPNIVKVFDVNIGDIIQYIVMEYIEGITLKEYIESNGTVSWKNTVHFTMQILNALRHAHSKGIIHRDVKPQNIMLLPDGTIKITDFGIARVTTNSTRTITDQAIGSVHYIAPEQAKGEPTDETADIYSVGVIMYEMLTGTLPFNADTAVSVAIMQMQSKPKPMHEINEDIPDGLEDITMKAMQKLPINRYQSANDMIYALEKFSENPSIKFAYKYLTNDNPTKYIDDNVNLAYNDNYQNSSNQSHNINYPSKAARQRNEYEDFSDKNSKKKYTTAVIWTGAIVLAFASILIVCALLGVFKSSNKDVDVPNFIGLKYDEVKNNTNYKFNFDVVNVYNKNKPEGEILDQDPKSGSKKIKETATIKLSVNSSGTTVILPTVKGLSQESAIEQLKKLNLSTEISTKSDPNVEKGKVIGTNPVAGSTVRVTDTITIIVSDGVEKVTIPSVAGSTISEAASTLQSKKLKVNTSIKYEDSDQPKDTVIGTDPDTDTEVDIDTQVTLIVSNGKNAQSTVNISVDLPDTDETSIKMDIYIDSVLKDTKYVKASGEQVSIPVTGQNNDIKEVSIYLNNKLYREYSVTMSTGNYTTRAYTYISETHNNPLFKSDVIDE